MRRVKIPEISERVPRPLGGIDDVNKLCVVSVARINAKGDGHDIEKHAIGSNHNVIRIWNLDNAGGAPVAETSSSSKIKAMCAHTNLESHFISSSDIYVAYAGDIYEYKDANDSNEVVSYRKNASEPGSYRVRRKSMNNSDTPGFLITIWIQSVLPEDISKEKTFTIRAHCASITALAILDGQTCHNRNNLITNNPLLISGADDKLVKIWNLYTGDPIYVVTIKCDYSMISDVENVTNSFTVGATIPALCVYYPDVSEAETLAIAARGAKNPSEMCDVPHLFIGTEHGIILCYNFDIVQSPSTAESDSHLGDFNCSFVLSKRFKMEGHMDGVNDFAILKQKNEKLERMDKVDRFLLSCGEDKSIIMWDIKRYGTILRTFTGHKGVVQCLCVSHAWENYGEEEVVISASWDHTIAVWNPRDGTLLKSIETPGTVVTVASFSEEITDRNVRKARSYMIYNNSDCGVAMSPIRISHTSLRYYGALYSEDHGYNTIANTTLSAPFHLVASVVKRWPTEENDAHVLKLVSTFDANTPFIQVRYKIDDEVSEHSKNDSIVLSTDNNRFGSVEESEVPFENVPARIKSYDILSKTTSAKSRISTTHKQLLIYSCGLMVKCYQVDIVKHKGSKQLGKSTSGDKLNDSKIHAAGSPAAHFDYSVKETCSVIVAKSSPVLSPPNAPVITPNGTSKKHFSFEETNNISNYVVDFSVCCSGDVFQQTPVIVVALLDSVLVYLLDPKDLTFSHEKCWVSLKNVDLYTSSFFRAAGQIQCLETYCVNLSDGTGENSKCLHIACGHEGGLISIVHFGEHEYEDKDGVEGILSLSAQVDEAALIATHCSQMRGHQDVVTTISHMPIYNDEGMVKLNCLVSGSKDSTFRVWDVGVEFKELAHGRDVESGVRTITILQHAIDDVKLNRIVVSCENYLIYVWDFDAAAVSVSLSKRLINHSNSVTSVDIINCKALDDCNVFYRSFKSKKKEKSNRAKGVSRPIYLLSSDRKMFNIWDVSMPKDTLPSISELEASMKYDVNKASGGVLDEETTRDVLLPFSASIRDLNFDFTLDVEEGELNKVAEVVVVNFTATELLVADPVRAYRTFAWHGTKLIPIAVQDGSWHFVDLVLTRCPRALLRNELRFMYFDNDPDTGSEIYKSLLYIALTQNRLIQVRVIVDCWISLLNENTGYAYDQIYMPGLCLPQEDLLLLSTVSPLEFERLVSSVKTKRAHNLVFGGKTAFPLRRPMVDGVMSPWECEAFWSTKFSRIHAKSRAIANAREERKVALNKIWRHFERMNVQHWLSLFALLKEIVRINVSNVIDRYVFPDVDTEEANQIATETEDLPDKLATGYFSPIVHCAHEKFFDACIEVCNKLDRNLLFDAPVVTLALKYSWTRFGRANHLRQCYKMAGFLILFALACFGFGVSQFDGSDGWIKFWVLGYVPQFLLLAVDLKFVWDELEQWRYGGDSLFEHFVLDIWNTFDGCAYLCILLGTVSRILLARDTDLSRELLACASVLMSAKLMYFFRAFESTGHLVAYMVQIIKGIGYFLYILFFIVIGFAGAFWLLSVGDTNSQCSSVDGAVFTTFTYLIGADAAPDIDASDRNQFYRFTYVLYIIVTMVVLLNLLIAIMGDIYGRAHAVAPAQFRWEQANVISDNMFLLTAEERRQFRVDPLVVHYLTAKNPLEKDDDNNAIDDSFEQNGSELGALKKQLLELTGKHESAMAALRSECNEQALELKMEQLKTNELLQSLIYEIKSKK